MKAILKKSFTPLLIGGAVTSLAALFWLTSPAPVDGSNPGSMAVQPAQTASPVSSDEALRDAAQALRAQADAYRDQQLQRHSG